MPRLGWLINYLEWLSPARERQNRYLTNRRYILGAGYSLSRRMEDEMETVGSLLLKMGRDKPTDAQISTLVSIRNRLADGEDREEIKADALTLADCSLWTEVLDLFKNSFGKQGKCTCGSVVPYVVHPFTLEERLYCEPCSERKEREAREIEREAMLRAYLGRADEILKRNGVPTMFLKARITDFGPGARKYATSKRGLYVTGVRGCGKTHFAVSLLREHLNNVRVIDRAGEFRVDSKTIPFFVSVPELLLEIRQSYSDSKSSEKEIIDKYTSYDCIVMDDLGVEKTTEWSLQILYIIVDRRYREEKRTIFTSNLSLDEMAAKLDDRVASRIVGMCDLVPMQGADRRLTK